jgi:hypothetical protein
VQPCERSGKYAQLSHRHYQLRVHSTPTWR